jgi:hypothetical protein
VDARDDRVPDFNAAVHAPGPSDNHRARAPILVARPLFGRIMASLFGLQTWQHLYASAIDNG